MTLLTYRTAPELQDEFKELSNPANFLTVSSELRDRQERFWEG